MTAATLRHAGWILRGNPLTGVAATGVFLLMLIAIFGPWIVPYDPIVSNVSQALMPPSVAPPPGDESARFTVSTPSARASCRIGTAKVLLVSPTPKVSVPPENV